MITCEVENNGVTATITSVEMWPRPNGSYFIQVYTEHTNPVFNDSGPTDRRGLRLDFMEQYEIGVYRPKPGMTRVYIRAGCNETAKLFGDNICLTKPERHGVDIYIAPNVTKAERAACVTIFKK